MNKEHRPTADETASPTGVQGEGDYAADRRYRAGVRQFIATTNVADAARSSAPESAAEAGELLEAERIGRSRVAGAPQPAPGRARESHEDTPTDSSSAGAPPSRR